MKVFSIPEDIFSEKEIRENDILIYHYASDKDSLKEKSVLTRNAFSLVVSGEKTMHFAEKTVEIHDDEIHLLSAGSYVASVSLGRQPFESVLIFFTDKVLLDFHATHADQIGRVGKGDRLTPSAYVTFSKDHFIRNYMESVSLLAQGNASTSMRRLKLEELMLYLLESQRAAFLSFAHSAKQTHLELKIKKVVELNKFNNLSIDELAFLCDISASTFKRHFIKIYGASPNTWLIVQRMKSALHMLKDRHERPGEIWHKLGFETHAGFTRSFKKHFGKLPKEFVS